jgi:hypothetical protein
MMIQSRETTQVARQQLHQQNKYLDIRPQRRREKPFMEDKRDPRTWQELLQRLAEDPKEKERIIQQTHIQPITLMRWIKGTCSPRAENLRALLKAIPCSSSQTFAQLLSVDFPDLLAEQTRKECVEPKPPLEFYTCVLSAYANMMPPLYPQLLRDLILQQMIKHFDPNRLGLSIRIAQCLWNPKENEVRSLHVMGGIGTPPWSRELDQQATFLGAESLAGIAVMQCRLTTASRQAENSALNFIHWGEHEQSLLAYPLMAHTRIAGSLLIASNQPDAFSETHHKLIERYAHLMALAFEPDAFFDTTDIFLHTIPAYFNQEPLFHQFRQRTLQTAQRRGLTLKEAQERVWQEIEEELIQLVGTES